MPNRAPLVQKRSKEKSNSLIRKEARKSGPTEYMNNLNFVLTIATTNTSPQRGILLNRFEEPDSRITDIVAGAVTVYDRNDNEVYEQTACDLSQAGFYGDKITFFSKRVDQTGKVVDTTKRTYCNKKHYFTAKEMIDNIVKFERVDRPKSSWFGGVDCHHVFFEGMRPDKKLKGAYHICWGS